MSKTTRGLIRCCKRHILGPGLYVALAPYMAIEFLEQLWCACGYAFRDRLYSPLVTVWGMVSQALSDNDSDRATVYRLAAWFGWQGSPRSGGYCKARKRLPLAFLEGAAKHVAHNAPPGFPAFPDHRVYVLDGSTVSLADTPENQAAYPQPEPQKLGCGFPVLRFVALMDHATGCIVDVVFGSLHVHDARLARPLWDRLRPGDVILADRGFASYGLLVALIYRGVHVVIRQHQRRKNKKPFSSSSVDDYYEIWTRPPKEPTWWGVKLPERLLVRVIRRCLPSGDTLVLNTLLPKQEYPAKALCQLYRARWRIETVFRDLKITLGLENVAPKTPHMARKVIWAHVLAYNLLCCLLVDVAATYGIRRSRLSLKSATDALAAGLTLAVQAIKHVWTWIAQQIARDILPHRPHRIEPRVKKRRPKQYPLMNQPRQVLRLNAIKGRA